MAHFKSNAGRKRWLGLQKKTKYAVGGLTPSTNMYGDNTIPYTASTVYEESNPEYQAQLADELQSVQTDTSYQEDANNEINRQNQVEGRVKQVGTMGLNKLADMAPEGYVAPDMGQNPRDLLKSSFSAANKQRKLNTIAQGGDKAVKLLNKSDDVGQLLEGLNTFGKGVDATSSVAKAGANAAKSGFGVGTVGALMAAGGDKLYDKVDDNDATTLTKKETGASALRGAGAGIGAISTASAIGATVLPGMFAVGAANAWNPIGWATLAAAGIGAGVTALNRKRKANKAGRVVDAADAKQAEDENRIKRQQRLEGLKDKQYSGFDYGGDNKGPGLYRKGGVRQYQMTGTRDVLADNRDPNKGFFDYNPSTKHIDIAAQNKRANSTEGLDVTYINPDNMQALSPERTAEEWEVIQNAQGPTPLGYAEIDGGEFEPRDKIEQDVYDNLGLEGVLKMRNRRAKMMASTDQAGKMVLAAGAAASLPVVLPEMLSLGTAIGNTNAGITATNLARFGATDTAVGRTLLKPFQHFGGNAINAYKNLSSGASAWNNTLNTAKLGYNAFATKGVADAYGSMANQIGTELEGSGNLQNRVGTASDMMSLFGGGKGPVANWLSKGVGGVTHKEVTKGYSDFLDKDYTSLFGRAVTAPFMDSSEASAGGMFRNIGKFINKATPNIDADDSIPGDINRAGSNAVDEGMNYFSQLGNYANSPSTFERASLSLPGRGYKFGGVKNLPGGQAIDIGNGATKYVGQTHEEGGIMADPQSEIENDEIEAPVTLADGSTNPYIYSEYLKTDGTKNYDGSKESIANVAEDLAINNAPQSEFDALAIQQEKLAGRSGNKIMDTTMAKRGGFKYQDRGIKKYQDEGLKPTLAGLQSQTNSNVTSMLQLPSTTSSIIPTRNTSLNRNELNLSGNTGLKNYGLNYMRTLSGGGKVGGNVNYTPDNISAGLKGSFGNNNNNTWSAGLNKSLVDPTSIMPTSNNGMNFNVGANFKWQDGGLKYQDRGFKEMRTPTDFGGVPLQRGSAIQGGAISAPRLGGVPWRKPLGSAISGGAAKASPDLGERDFRSMLTYKEGGVRNYQTQGVVMSEDRQRQFANLITFVPNVGYIGPDGTNYGFNERDVVGFVNRGGLDEFNPNEVNNYYNTNGDEAGRGQTSNDLGYVNTDSLEAWDASDYGIETETRQDTFDPIRNGYTPSAAEIELINQNYTEEAGRIENLQRVEAAQQEAARLEAELLAEAQAEAQAEAAATTARNRAESARKAQMKADADAWGGSDFSDSESDPFGVVPSGGDPANSEGPASDLRTSSGLAPKTGFGGDPATTESLQAKSDAVQADLAAFNEKIAQEEADAAYNALSAKEKRQLKNKNRGKGVRGAGNGRLLKAAQFIPAALAYMDKPDYMNNPEKIGDMSRVNLENVSLSDRQASIKSDNAAMQRFISNAGMGTAGFSARMAGWQRKEGLAAAVTAEERRMNAEINNREATMNVDVDARNKAIQGQNRQAAMDVDRFNTESKAATKAQRVSAVANATQGLLTQFMDKQRIDADDRRTLAIQGQTKVMDREGPTNETNRHFAGTDITSLDQEWLDYYDGVVSATKKKFGGMRKIPRYGYSK